MATKTVVMAAMSWHVVSQTSSSYGATTWPRTQAPLHINRREPGRFDHVPDTILGNISS